MNRHDFNLVGITGTALGIAFWMGAAVANTYYETAWLFVHYPYRGYVAPLFIAGLIAGIVGQAFLWRARQETGQP